MATTRPSRTLSVSISHRPADVYAFASNPENLPRWSFLTKVWRDGDTWMALSPDGTVSIRFVEPNALGVLDHFVTVGPGVEIYVPMRVVPNGKGSEVVFTLFRLDGMTEDAFENDAAIVARDLETLKRVLEAEGSRPPGKSS